MLNLLLKLTKLALCSAENPLYISPPRKKLLLLTGGTVLLWIVLFCLTFILKPLIFFTPPFLVCLSYVYIMLSRIWCAYKYSPFYPVSAAVLACIIVFLCKYLTYIY